MQEKGNKFRDKRTPKKPVKIEMNDPNAENPEIVIRRNLSPVEYVSQMIDMIDNQRAGVLAQIKQSRDILKILNIDKKQSIQIREILKKNRKR